MSACVCVHGIVAFLGKHVLIQFTDVLPQAGIVSVLSVCLSRVRLLYLPRETHLLIHSVKRIPKHSSKYNYSNLICCM